MGNRLSFIEAVGGANSGRWLIRVIRGGRSLNGNFYPSATLQAAVPLFEGARVFEKTDEEHVKGAGKAFSKLIGGLVNPRFVPPSVDMPQGAIDAELHLIDPAGPVGTKIRMAHERGLSGLFGFSIDAQAVTSREVIEGKPAQVAKRFTEVNSVDLIIDPGAGGELVKMIEAVAGDDGKEKGEMSLRARMVEVVTAVKPDFNPEGVSDDALMVAYREALSSEPARALREAKEAAQAAITAARLPEVVKRRLLERFAGAVAVFTVAEVDKAIEEERDYAAKLTESGKPRMPFVEVEDEGRKVSDMLDAFFDPGHKDHRHARSFRECYVIATGDREVTGDLRNCDTPRLRALSGEGHLREAVLSTSWANALGDAVTRRMLKVYEGETDLQAWRKVAAVVQVADFRTQERLRVGGYGNLPGVNEGAPYAPLATPGDGVATYAVSKRGGTESVTLEATINDDVLAVRNIPTELALAAANTLYEFVFDFYRSNPVIYDGKALYHADHGNLFTAALGDAAFMAQRLAMGKQVRPGSSKRLRLKPRTLLAPMDMEEAAYNLFIRDTNLDPTFVQTVKPEVVVVSYWGDTNDWCTVADPQKLPALEIGFLNGREDPELFVQDMPNSGSLFSHDVITYKIRHIYGGAVPVDGEKATTKSVVA